MTSNRRPVKRHRSNHPSNPSTTLVKSFDHLPKAVLGHVCSFLNSHDHKMVAANISQRFKKAAKCRHAWNGKVVFRWAKLLSKEEEKNGISSVRICEHINRLIETWNEWVSFCFFVAIFFVVMCAMLGICAQGNDSSQTAQASSFRTISSLVVARYWIPPCIDEIYSPLFLARSRTS